MKNFILIIGLLFLIFSVSAQQYIIRYDLAADNIRYLKIKKTGDTIPSTVIHLSQTSNINLQLVNVSNSYQRQIILHEKIEIPENIIIPGIGNTSLESLSGGLLNLDFKNLKSEDLFKELIPGNKSTGFEKREMAINAFIIGLNTFNDNYIKWQHAVLFDQECKRLWKELADLRYSIQYTAQVVKHSAQIKTVSLFPEITGNTNALLLKETVVNPADLEIELQKNNQVVNNIFNTFSELDIQSAEAASLLKEIESKIIFVKKMSNTYDESSTNDILMRISEIYNKIMNDSYTQLSSLPVNRKTIMAQIQFIPKIDSITATAIGINTKDTITRWVNIYKKEPLKFRNTFGFGFVSFAEARSNYYVAPDSTIAKEGGDHFQPLAGTFLHFYSPRDKGFRWGGSFGMGIPLSGDNKQVNILLGLSTFLGKNDPICITAGVAGAKTRNLSGVALGEKVNSTDYNIKYQSVYRSSFFIGFSFNPTALNNRN